MQILTGASPVATGTGPSRLPGQSLLNWHQVGGVSRSSDRLFAQHGVEPTRGRPGRYPTPTSATHRGRPCPPYPTQANPNPSSVPLPRLFTQQGTTQHQRRWTAHRYPAMEPTMIARGCGPTRAGDVAPSGPTLGPLQRTVLFHQRPGGLASVGPPIGASCGNFHVRRGSGTQRANPGPPAAQRSQLPTPRGSGTQWTTTGARTTSAETMKVCAPTERWGHWASRTWQRGEAGGGRPGAIGPHTHENAAKHGVDNLNVKESGQQNRKTTPSTTGTTPVRQLLGPATVEMTP